MTTIFGHELYLNKIIGFIISDLNKSLAIDNNTNPYNVLYEYEFDTGTNDQEKQRIYKIREGYHYDSKCLGNLDIETLLNLCLVDKKIHNFINQYINNYFEKTSFFNKIIKYINRRPERYVEAKSHWMGGQYIHVIDDDRIYYSYLQIKQNKYLLLTDNMFKTDVKPLTAIQFISQQLFHDINKIDEDYMEKDSSVKVNISKLSVDCPEVKALCELLNLNDKQFEKMHDSAYYNRRYYPYATFTQLYQKFKNSLHLHCLYYFNCDGSDYNRTDKIFFNIGPFKFINTFIMQMYPNYNPCYWIIQYEFDGNTYLFFSTCKSFFKVGSVKKENVNVFLKYMGLIDDTSKKYDTHYLHILQIIIQIVVDISNKYKIYQDKYLKSAYKVFKYENVKCIGTIKEWYDDEVINKNYKLDPEQYRNLFYRIYDSGMAS